MKALHKSLLAAAILGGSLFGTQVHALPTCDTVIGMTLTAPGGTAQSPDASGCTEITGGYNYSFERYVDIGLDPDAFIAELVAKWGGVAADWVFLGEMDNRSDNSSNQYAFDYYWDNRRVPAADQNSDNGSFSIDVNVDDRLPPGTPFESKTLDVVGIMKPDNASGRGTPSDPSSYPDTVLAYLFSDIEIANAGTLSGTFDFRESPTSGSDYIWSGVAMFGRLATIPTPPGRIPEPGVLTLVCGAAVAAALARRRARTA